ncbi:MAG: prephenate dehydrogenase/arogenate dehydrogenase family protein, partial [Chloroflexi bacterium]|nr:prephenate dehydrogenase/arogenate dehydrogenase family protein [Chloroflexota bacterium]
MRVAVAGLGLIGGSLALALRDTHSVTGWSPSASTRALAAKARLTVVDSLEALVPADAVVVAAPLDEVVPTLERLVPRAGSAVLLDVGSLKGPVAAFAERAPAGARIVGGHPMAGTTQTGFAAADADLFRGRPFLLVPTARSDENALALAGDLARAVGAVVTVIGAAEHDRIVAALSALPLAVASALARTGADAAGAALA